MPSALVFDGAHVWIGNPGDTTVTKLRASDGSRQGSFSVAAPPDALLFDGIHVWASSAFDPRVTRL